MFLGVIALEKLKLDLVPIKKLYDQQEDYNNDAILSHDNFLKEMSSNLEPDEREEFYDIYSEELIYNVELFPQLIKVSAFLQMYFAFENGLNDYCNAYSNKLGANITVYDFGGSGITRAKNFLRKVAPNIDEPFKTKEWQQIRTFSTLRNKLVHEDGYFNDENVKDFEKKEAIPPGVEFTETSSESKLKIILKEDFINHVYNTFLTFINNLQKQ
ncbi:hypothetical protein [Bacillus subtilis]|uniref:hypothetical protein n=1 Tax=Bacillus subtilis TaxID=1423 RepID=UPI0022F3A183|nr:hypothetical protein [Bacillus subtilis]WBY39799.1 hypothetical protein PF977_10830 [Bacillus subtilis]